MVAGNLYGRDAELTRVVKAMAAGRAIAVVGEAGVGKTSLVRAAAASAGMELREGGALETLAWLPLLALKRALGDGLSGDATSVAIEVERRLGPQILFIDDLQWTDDSTREILARLAGRVAIVLAIRATDPGAATATELARWMGAEMLELEGVDREAAAAILRHARPALDAAGAAVLVDQGGGNPLLLEELATRGQPTTNLARALTSRLDGLSPDGRDAFALLAVAGHGLPATALGSGAAELVSGGVAVAVGRDLAPRHALFAEAMLATLSPSALARTHDRVAGLIEDTGERAYHLAGAGRRAEALAAANDGAGQALTPGDRAALLELAARMTEGPEATLARIVASRLLVASGGAGSIRAIALLEPVVDGSHDLLVEREGLLGRAYWDSGDLVASRAAFERGMDLDVGPPSIAGARLAAGDAAFVANVDGNLSGARRILAEAIASGRGHGRVMATNATINAFVDGLDTFDVVESAYRTLLEDNAEVDGAFGLARNVQFIGLICRGYDSAHDFLVRAIGDFDRIHHPGRADELRSEDVQVLLMAGRLGEGLALADSLLERPLGQRPRQWVLTKKAQLLSAMGQGDAASEILDELASWVTSDYAGQGELLAARVDVESWAGRPTAVLEAVADHRALPGPSEASYLMPFLDGQWARLESRLDPGPAIGAQPWPMMAAAVLESAGIRALFEGHPEEAGLLLGRAADLWTPFHIGRQLICQAASGEALRRAGAPGAERVLRGALDQSQRLGYGPLAVRIRRSLRLAGIRVAPPPRETDTQRWARMTSREREALQLVGRGLTTPQIARRMGLGRGTVDQILGSATRKAGAASRLQAAAMLASGPGTKREARQVTTVQNEADAGQAVLAALGGASLSVEPGADPAIVERIQADLHRLGRDDAISFEPARSSSRLSSDGAGLLGLLAEGMSLGEAAASLHLSRRTADRRLGAARRALGVTTTAEALIEFQRRPAP